MKLTTCNHCGQVFLDPNPGNESENYPDSNLFDSLEWIEIDKEDPRFNFWGCPTCKIDHYLNDNINWPALNNVYKIVVRKKLGQDCSEAESAEIKMWLKSTHIRLGTYEVKLQEDIQILFPNEYGEALDESLQNEKGFKN